MRKLFCIALAVWLTAQPALARSFIRDAEIEQTLRLMSDPILAAADIEPGSVRIFLIGDASINAFVAGGQNIFFHTGLIQQVESPAMLMGVIAHEAGHISGAHLTQLSAASSQASLGALLSYVLGAAAVVAGSGQAGAAVISAGQNTAMRNLLSHYRGNEQQADQAGVEYLRAIGLSPAGMLETFELLRRKERQHIGAGGDPYLRTHPLTTDRIAALRGEVERAQHLPTQPDEALRLAFLRAQAKLDGFLLPPADTLRRYGLERQDEAALMARAVAYFKQPNLEQALKEADALIALSPGNPFNYDLKAQFLFEHGRIDEAIRAYETANDMQPNNGLILTYLGKALIAKDRYQEAIDKLEQAARLEHTSANTHRQLAVAYASLGDHGKSLLSLAREAALSNEPDDVIRYASQAKSQLADNAILALQADDLIADAKRVKKEQD